MLGLSEIIQSIWNVLLSIRITDIIDMALLSYLIYHGIRLVRETRAQQLIKGIIVLPPKVVLRPQMLGSHHP